MILKPNERASTASAEAPASGEPALGLRAGGSTLYSQSSQGVRSPAPLHEKPYGPPDGQEASPAGTSMRRLVDAGARGGGRPAAPAGGGSNCAPGCCASGGFGSRASAPSCGDQPHDLCGRHSGPALGWRGAVQVRPARGASRRIWRLPPRPVPRLPALVGQRAARPAPRLGRLRQLHPVHLLLLWPLQCHRARALELPPERHDRPRWASQHCRRGCCAAGSACLPDCRA